MTNREQFLGGIQLLSPVQSETWKTWSGVFTECFEWGGEIKVTPVFSYSLTGALNPQAKRIMAQSTEVQ